MEFLSLCMVVSPDSCAPFPARRRQSHVSLREKTVVREQRKRKPCHAVGSSARGKSDELTLAVGDGDGFLGK